MYYCYIFEQSTIKIWIFVFFFFQNKSPKKKYNKKRLKRIIRLQFIYQLFKVHAHYFHMFVNIYEETKYWSVGRDKKINNEPILSLLQLIEMFALCKVSFKPNNSQTSFF